MTNRPTDTLPIPGHALAAEGAPHDERGRRIDGLRTPHENPSYTSTAGTGRAMCECGALSEVLPSRNARTRWHRGHKTAIRTGHTEITVPTNWVPAVVNPGGIAEHWVLTSTESGWDLIRLSVLTTEAQAHALAHRLNGGTP